MLLHFSEQADIEQFIPRKNHSYPELPPAVWAIDEAHAPLYFFPRDCPRIAFWVLPDTNELEREQYAAATTARMVIATESRWLEQIRRTRLYVYHFEEGPFSCFDQGAGYFIANEPILPVRVEPVGDLLQRLAESNVELRLTPSLFPLQQALLQSSLHVSMIRMRNAVHSK
ncbi:MAG: DUF6886 family protein [Clostridia bacterium]